MGGFGASTSTSFFAAAVLISSLWPPFLELVFSLLGLLFPCLSPDLVEDNAQAESQRGREARKEGQRGREREKRKRIVEKFSGFFYSLSFFVFF